LKATFFFSLFSP